MRQYRRHNYYSCTNRSITRLLWATRCTPPPPTMPSWRKSSSSITKGRSRCRILLHVSESCTGHRYRRRNPAHHRLENINESNRRPKLSLKRPRARTHRIYSFRILMEQSIWEILVLLSLWHRTTTTRSAIKKWWSSWDSRATSPRWQPRLKSQTSTSTWRNLWTCQWALTNIAIDNSIRHSNREWVYPKAVIDTARVRSQSQSWSWRARHKSW